MPAYPFPAGDLAGEFTSGFREFTHSLPSVGAGLWVTVQATVLGALLAFALGFMARSRRALVRGTARAVVEFFRGTSLYVQMFWLFFALPVLGFKLVSLACASRTSPSGWTSCVRRPVTPRPRTCCCSSSTSSSPVC